MMRHCTTTGLFTRVTGLILSLVCPGSAATLPVGPDKPFSSPCAAIAAAHPGDVIEVDPDTAWTDDTCLISTPGLTIRSGGGKRPRIRSSGDVPLAPGNAIWTVAAPGITIDGFELHGAKGTGGSRTGAAIRVEPGFGVTVMNCFLHGNEVGLATAEAPEAEVLIERTAFVNNGPSGAPGNLDIGRAGKLTLRFSYSQHAGGGPLLRSRALENYLLYNHFSQDAGAGSPVELPHGGRSFVLGNVIRQGPGASSGGMLLYLSPDGLAAANPSQELFIVNNTFVNEATESIFVASLADTPAVIANNIFYGLGEATNQAAAIFTNNFSGDPGFAGREAQDYRLQSDSPAINTGTELESVAGFPLRPEFHYVHPLCGVERVAVGVTDIGAYEFGGSGEGGCAVGDPAASGTEPRLAFNAAADESLNLEAYWPMDEGSGNVAADFSGNGRHGAVNGAAWTTDSKTGKALLFSSAAQYVNAGTFDVTGSALTISAWVKANSFPEGTDPRIISKATSHEEQDHYFMLGVYGGKLRFRLKTSGTTKTLIASSGGVSAGKWVHAVATYDGTAMRLYQDGVEVGSLAVSGSITGNSAVPVWIGLNPDGAGRFDGIIDQVRIYNRALSLAEISSLDQGTPAVAVSVSPLAASLTASETQQFSAAVTGTANTAVTWSLSPQVGTISSAGLYTAPAAISSVQTVTVKATSVADGTKSATAAVTLNPPVASPSSDLVAYWPMDEGSGSVAADLSGNGRHGAINGATWTTDSKSGKALRFSSATQYVNAGTFDVTGSTLTISAWVKANSFPANNDPRIISKATSTAEQDHYFMLGIYGGKLRARLKTSGTTKTLIASGGGVTAGKWVHAVATYDGTRLRLYQDGVEVGSMRVSGAITGNPAVPVWIGLNPDGAGRFDGIIDQVRMYNRALSLSEIKNLN